MASSAQLDDETGCFYPMYGVSVDNFLRMSGPPAAHQDLLNDGLLDRYHASLHFTFVSHQWVGCGTPDPKGFQLGMLRKALSSGFRAVSSLNDEIQGGGRKNSDEAQQAMLQGFLWIDFFGVPQIGVKLRRADMRDFKAAIDSIPSYVRLCKAFVALAPSMFHEDGSIVNFGTYLSRGWCRAELLFWKLTADAQPKPVVSLRGAGNAFYYESGGLSEGLSPHTAVFTAEDDRAIVCGLVRDYMHELIAQQVAEATETEVGSKLWKQLMSSALFKAVDVEFFCGSCDDSTLQRSSRGKLLQRPCLTFQQCYAALDEAVARTHLGINRMTLAAFAGKEHLLRTAFEIAAADDMQMRTKVPHDESKFIGFTPLHFAAYAGHVACIKILLDHRADLNSKAAKFQLTPFGRASMSKRACVETIQVLLSARAHPDSGCSAESAIHLAGSNDLNTSKITRLLEARADAHSKNIVGGSLLMVCAGNYADSRDAIELLVRARASVDAPTGKPNCLLATVTAFAKAGDAIFGSRGEGKQFRALLGGSTATALHIATYSANWNVCAALLAHGASTEAKVKGRTPREIARVLGTEDIFQHLVDTATTWI